VAEAQEKPESHSLRISFRREGLIYYGVECIPNVAILSHARLQICAPRGHAASPHNPIRRSGFLCFNGAVVPYLGYVGTTQICSERECGLQDVNARYKDAQSIFNGLRALGGVPRSLTQVLAREE
jgi:hypothetical protein